MDEPTRLTLTANPALAGALAQMLEREGVRVEWESVEERRTGLVEAVVIPMLLWGGQKAIEAAVRHFRNRFPNAKVEVEPPPGEAEPPETR